MNIMRSETGLFAPSLTCISRIARLAPEIPQECPDHLDTGKNGTAPHGIHGRMAEFPLNNSGILHYSKLSWDQVWGSQDDQLKRGFQLLPIYARLVFLSKSKRISGLVMISLHLNLLLTYFLLEQQWNLMISKDFNSCPPTFNSFAFRV